MRKSNTKVLNIWAKLSLKIWKFAIVIRFHSVLPGVTWNGALVASKINVSPWNLDRMCIFMIETQWFPRFFWALWPKFHDRETKTGLNIYWYQKPHILAFIQNKQKDFNIFRFNDIWVFVKGVFGPNFS